MLSSTVAIILTTIALLSFTTSEPVPPGPNPSTISGLQPGSQNNVIIGYFPASAAQYQPLSNVPWSKQWIVIVVLSPSTIKADIKWLYIR